MPRHLVRHLLAFAMLAVSAPAFALGLGEIRLKSALNAPLRAEIELLSASPDELNNLRIDLADAATFERYGLDRPFYLQDISFEIVRSGRADGNIVRVSSLSPITEPFLTFLVEANWSRGRLLREYTVLLDPPTYAPPADSQPAVTAPSRATPTDSARIERQPAPADTADERPDPVTPPPQPRRRDDNVVYDTTPGGDYVVRGGDTLWGIASRNRADSSLTMNQMMLAIFEANPEAFGGNINVLREGALLRIPSADNVYRIDRGSAFSEVQRQNDAWGGSTPAPQPTPQPRPEPSATAVEDDPTLILVPPDDDEAAGLDSGLDTVGEETDEPLDREQQILDRIAELEAMDVPQQRSLIEIRDNELATLREELSRIRGEDLDGPVDDIDMSIDEDFPQADTDDPAIDDDTADSDGTEGATAVDDTAADADDGDRPSTVIRTRRAEPTLLEKIAGFLGNVYVWIAAAVLLVVAALVWFMRRGRDSDDDPDTWRPLDDGELATGAMAGDPTETLRAPSHDESIVVEEAQVAAALDDTMEADTPTAPVPTDGDGSFGSLEDTFSSETAINLDQTDPLAEADFHMAYGLYDQAADLVNGALEAEPGREDLLAKLCEIYFVWGNRDAFVDAAGRLKAAVGDGGSPDWDKTVIMGQQIAADDPLFSGASVGATEVVDLSFGDDDDAGELDMEFGDESGSAEILDLGAADDRTGGEADGEVDFLFDGDGAADVDEDAETQAVAADDSGVLDFDMTGAAAVGEDATVEMPADDEATVETPTIEEAIDTTSETSVMPAVDDAVGAAIEDSGQAADETAEIDLDDLDLDMGDLESLDDSFDDGDFDEDADSSGETGRNPEVDPDATGVQRGLDSTGINELLDPDATAATEALDDDSTGVNEELDVDFELPDEGMRLAADETGQNPLANVADLSDESDATLDVDLLAATGRTQVLTDDMAVDADGSIDDEGEDEYVKTEVISDDQATLMASLDDEDPDSDAGGDAAIGDDDATMMAPRGDDDFDFAKTEALPASAFTDDNVIDETGEMPVASTDLDLDLDDLTAALQVSGAGDTVDMPRDEATVEQPRPDVGGETSEIDPDELSDELQEARTMTEVGTKLDLARAYVDMGDPGGARSILEEVLDEGDESQRQQAQQLLDSLPS